MADGQDDLRKRKRNRTDIGIIVEKRIRIMDKK